MFFFFQAEDGIRDRDVTGVQTCALPISEGTPARTNRLRVLEHEADLSVQVFLLVVVDRPAVVFHGARCRSEERRVGKECRFGWWRWRLELKGCRWASVRWIELCWMFVVA